jgi:hypothetical protein
MNVDQIEKTVRRFQTALNDAKDDLNRQKGALDVLMKRLKDDYGMDSLEKAQDRLNLLKSKQLEYEETITGKLKEIEAKYEF